MTPASAMDGAVEYMYLKTYRMQDNLRGGSLNRPLEHSGVQLNVDSS